MKFLLSFMTMYPCEHTNIIGPTYCKLWDHSNPLQRYAVEFFLNRKCKLAVAHSILTCSSLYNPEDFPLLLIIMFLTCSQQQVMASWTPQTGATVSESSRATDASSNAPPGEAQLYVRHQLVHCDAAIAATENITHNAHLKMIRHSRSSTKRKQHAIRCEQLHIVIGGGQLAI